MCQVEASRVVSCSSETFTLFSLVVVLLGLHADALPLFLTESGTH